MHNWNDKLAALLQELEREIGILMDMEAISFQTADPPSLPGVYIIYDHSGTLSYVGEASGSGGLKDRLKKHLSGDENHAIQRAYKDSIPDRSKRREFIIHTLKVKWLATHDGNTAAVLERMLILMAKPPWNRK